MRTGRDTLVKFITFKENECEAIEQYLEEKALEGWILNDISCSFFIFKKSQPKDYKFSVDIFTDLKTGEYIDFCEASGWQHLCSTNHYLIFFTEDKNITPIQTDEEIVLTKVGRAMAINIFIYIWISFSMVNNAYNTFFVPNLEYSKEIYGNDYVFMILICAVFTICPIIEIIRSGLWYFKFKKLVSLNENANYPSLKALKVKSIFLNLYIGTLIIVMIALVVDLGYLNTYVYTGFVLLLIVISVSKAFRIIKD